MILAIGNEQTIISVPESDSPVFVSTLISSLQSRFTTPATLVSVTVETAEADSTVDVGKLELIVDLPVQVGCFSADDPTSVTGNEGKHLRSIGCLRLTLIMPCRVTAVASAADMTPEKCLDECVTNFPMARYAFLRNGDQCFCHTTVPDNLLKVTDDSCTTPCGGDSNRKCGGPENTNHFSVFVATCPDGQRKFGEYCYFTAKASGAENLNILENEDLCAERVSSQPCRATVSRYPSCVATFVGWSLVVAGINGGSRIRQVFLGKCYPRRLQIR